MGKVSALRDANPQTLSAGLTASIWFLAGSLPLLIAVAERLEASNAHTASWIFVSYLACGLSGIGLSLYYRQPIAIGYTIPGMIYIGTIAGQFSLAEIVGANIVAGVVIVAFGAFGLGSFVLRILPLPIVLGMFAGSILSYVTRLVTATIEDGAIGGATIFGYLLGRFLAYQRLPPLLLALIFGGIASGMFSNEQIPTVNWVAPSITIPNVTFSLAAVLTIALPMVILSAGLGTVQGLGFLKSQGYKVAANAITLTVGIGSTVSAIFGAVPTIVARSAGAILASTEAGPKQHRYIGSVVASFSLVIIALFAMPLASLLGLLPKAYVVVLAGLAIFSALQEATEKAITSDMKSGALVAFCVAATPFSLFGITSSVWAIVAGISMSAVVEREAFKSTKDKK
tara:strand:- start:91 stop:1287 length:1197 start_codon:yes stop_codon:yes gene_type:complete